MFDLHIDLLSILYYSYILNDYSYVEKLQYYFKKNNIKGVVANLYFEEESSMLKLINNRGIDVVNMFELSKILFEKYFPNLEVIYSIEGCDYILSTSELEYLKNLGLDSILLVWNNENKYGSGNRSNKGLTDEGIDFLQKAIELGLIIDLSHMNKFNFYDTVNLLNNNKNRNPKVIVSHSNSYEIHNHPRNLDDDQLYALKDFNPLMGLVIYNNFIGNENMNLKIEFLKHIKHIESILGIDSISIATDDMSFENILFNYELKPNLFSYEFIQEELVELLTMVYNKEQVEAIMYKNAKNFFVKERKK